MIKCNIIKSIIFLFLAVLTMAGCATVPSGPSVMALPGEEKTFEQFQADDAVCRQWAAERIGLSPQETVSQNTAAGAVAGTAIGAGLGAAIGAASGDAGTGAAIGAASGLLFGTAAGASIGQYYGGEAQRRYDIAYTQCMYAKGNDIPEMVMRPHQLRRSMPQPGSDYPPPYPETVPPEH